MEDDDSQAMNAVLEDMGRVAKAAKAKKYAPKPPPAAPAAAEPVDDGPQVSASELEALLSGG